MNISAFKAYDIRGAYPSEVDEELAYLVGRAIVKYFSAKTIVVGRDMRNSSPSLLSKLIEGITYEGANVVNIGLCTTPMLNFAVANYGYDGGIMVSASHNPGGDNAFKVIDKNVIQLDGLEGLNDLKNMVKAGLKPSKAKVGSVITREIFDDYLANIKKNITSLPALKVAVDYGNGVGAVSGTRTFESYGINLIELYPEPSGDFPNHQANPHDLSNFTDLINSVKENNADLGVFFDGDADRANFVDDIGRIVPADLLIVLLAEEELKEKKSGNVYYDLRFSKAVPTLIKKYGGSPFMMRVGNPFYKRVLREKGGIIGAEFAGHIMYPENYNIDDGLYAVLKTIKMLGNRGKKLSQLIDEVNIFCASPEESMEAKNPDTVSKRLIDAFPEAKQIELDGVYLDFGDDGFISVRQSQNELQLFRIRVEARTSEGMQTRFDKVKKIVAEG